MDRPDEITTSTAAALVGVSSEMLRRVVRAGHIAVHRRGFTTVSGAVQGYSAFLRQEAERAEANTAAARALRAKAATVTAANQRRRAGLAGREEAERVIADIAAIACHHAAGFTVSGVSAATAARVTEEAREAIRNIEVARDHALAILRGEATDDGE